jgi:hypothetical protein
VLKIGLELIHIRGQNITAVNYLISLLPSVKLHYITWTFPMTMATYEHLTAVPLDLPARETYNKNKLAFIVDGVYSKKVRLRY